MPEPVLLLAIVLVWAKTLCALTHIKNKMADGQPARALLDARHAAQGVEILQGVHIQIGWFGVGIFRKL